MHKLTVFLGAAALSMAAAQADETSKPSRTTSSSSTAIFESLDKNADQQISKTEAASDKGLADSFAAVDANGDGYLNKSEFLARTKS